MKIGGYLPFSLSDYPGCPSAIIFTQGCNFRCPYCHNPELVIPRLYQRPIPEKEAIEFLEKRKGRLEGATITGGEPLLQKNIFAFLGAIKKRGYRIKLDTNGSFPDRLERIVKDKLADYIAMDIKAPLERYAQIAGANVNTEDIKTSIKIVMRSKLGYQFRTTIGKSFLSVEDIKQICGLIKGAHNYVLQKYVPADKAPTNFVLSRAEYSEAEIQRYQDLSSSLIQG